MFDVRDFFADESAGTAIEYAMVLGLVSLAGLAAWGAMGATLDDTYNGLSTSVDDSI